MALSEIDQRRGYAAKRILNDADIMAAFGEIEADLFTEWAHTARELSSEREEIYRQVQSLELFQKKLETWRNNMLLFEAVSEQSIRDARGAQSEA